MAFMIQQVSGECCDDPCTRSSPCDPCGGAVCPYPPYQSSLTLTYELWVRASSMFSPCYDYFGTVNPFRKIYDGEVTFTRQTNNWLFLATAKKERQWYSCTNSGAYYTNQPTPTLVFDSSTTTWNLNLNSAVSSGIGNIAQQDCNPRMISAIYTANNQGVGPNTTDIITFTLS